MTDQNKMLIRKALEEMGPQNADAWLVAMERDLKHEMALLFDGSMSPSGQTVAECFEDLKRQLFTVHKRADELGLASIPNRDIPELPERLKD